MEQISSTLENDSAAKILKQILISSGCCSFHLLAGMSNLLLLLSFLFHSSQLPWCLFLTLDCVSSSLSARPLGLFNGGFLKIIPSRSCQGRWGSVRRQRAATRIEPATVSRRRVKLFWARFLADRCDVDGTVLAIDFVAIACQKAGATSRGRLLLPLCQMAK